ncbi:formate dehydrogenase accessory sulfurtransferase FdhD [Mucilaginibacter arboris]|uniref:Sulfur carrier protein FdhD n=1 Tax=Mucilaginibacter arboris TaxID=2682090 RepID=A0A7K1SY65_9SPHI|nr:formate dehydrogenase accessory sulfurtransferase FdhD [Mucilaginibacter arboris]MVN22265.1 formate dehydrogenase accessory sulfurtransferase FdhD [Mucilaginibacter arboris]
MPRTSVTPVTITKVNEKQIITIKDFLAAEEPLEIRLGYGPAEHRQQKSISVTMRTPGNDFELAIGFLFTEGIIENIAQVASIKHCNGLHENVVRVELIEGLELDMGKLERNFYTTSSCGVCGKSSIDAVKTVCRLPENIQDDAVFSSEVIYRLPGLLRQNQSVFNSTGGLHGCALFNPEGNLMLAREDVGRHNALDKLIGATLQQSLFPLNKYLLLLSGRASFELIQKAYMAGIKIVAAVGAPSSLAVQMAADAGITLIGFLRGEKFNIYCGEQRISLKGYQKEVTAYH